MRIGMLTQWFDPEPGPAALPGMLARELVERGHEVRVLTGYPNYPSGQIAQGYSNRGVMHETLGGVQVRRVPLRASHGDSIASRLSNYGSFGVSALARGGSFLAEADALWINYSPVTIGLPWLADPRLRRIPAFVHVMDLWPDTVTASGFDSPILRRVEGTVAWWCSRMYDQASRVGYISTSVGPALRARGVPEEKLVYAPVWADETRFAPVADSVEEREGLLLSYAGTIGGAQALEILVRASALARDAGVRCVIAGSGPEQARLSQLATELDAPVEFLGRVSPDVAATLTKDSDASFVGLNDHPLAGMTMPSKLQSLLAAGRPVVAVLEGDAAQVVREAGAGWVSSPGAGPEALAGVLREVAATSPEKRRAAGDSGRLYYERTFSLRTGVDRIEQELLRMAGRGGPVGSVRLRELRPTDAEDCARVHLAAFPEFFLARMGRPFLVQLYRGFAEDDTALTVVATDSDGEVLGSVVGTTEPAGFFRRLLRRRVIRFGLASLPHLARHPSDAMRVARGLRYRGGDEHPAGAALLSSICVTPGAPRGTGRMLMDGWLAALGTAGGTSAYLMTDAHDNDRVNVFYSRGGWRLDGSETTPEGRVLNRYVWTAGSHEQE